MCVVNHVFARGLILVMAAVLLTACGGKEERKAKYLERGKTFLAEENYDKARLEFKNVLQIDPKTAEAYLYLGEIEEKKQNWPQSFGNYKRASELDPELIAPRVDLAQMYMAQAAALLKQGERKKDAANALGLAQEQVKAILSREPDNLEGLTLEASLWVNDGDVDKAVEQLERVVATDPGLQIAAVLLSNIYQQKDRYDDAEKVLLDAIANNAEPIDLQTRLAALYITRQELDKAEGVLREIVNEDSEEVAHRVSLASFLAKTGQIDKAEKVLRDLIASDPKDAQRYVLLTQFLAAKRGQQIALSELKQAIEQHPEISDLKLELVRLYLSGDQKDEAKATLADIIDTEGTQPTGIKARVLLARILAAEDSGSDKVQTLVSEVLRENPGDNDALLLKGKIAAKQGEYAEAIGDFRSVLKDRPNSPEVLQLLASAHLANGEAILARDTLMRGVENNPKDASLRLALAEVLVQAEDVGAALEQVDAVLRDDEYHERALAAKFELLKRKGDMEGMETVAKLMQAGAPDKDDGFIREVRLRIAKKDYSGALKILDGVLEKNPRSIPALLAKSEALASQGKIDAAIAVAQQLQEASPDSAVGYFVKGQLLQGDGKADAALIQYEKALGKAPESAEIIAALIDTEIKHSGFEKVERRLLNLLANNPDHTSANDFLGLIYIRNKDFAKAEKSFQDQIAVNPENALGYAQLAQTRLALNDIAGAANAYRDGIEASPDNNRLLIGLAGIEEKREDFDAAISLYEKILETQPDNAVGINNLAALLSDHRRDAESLSKAARLAEKLEKTNQPAFIDTAGWVYYRMGEYTRAIEILKDVVSQAPEVPVFRYHLGMAYLKVGDKAAAKQHLLKATEGDPTYTGVEEARAALKNL